jgi:hypothetical protein
VQEVFRLHAELVAEYSHPTYNFQAGYGFHPSVTINRVIQSLPLGLFRTGLRQAWQGRTGRHLGFRVKHWDDERGASFRRLPLDSSFGNDSNKCCPLTSFTVMVFGTQRMVSIRKSGSHGVHFIAVSRTPET